MRIVERTICGRRGAGVQFGRPLGLIINLA
jgi:hypothetical protein